MTGLPAPRLAVLGICILLVTGVAAANEPPVPVIDAPANATVGDVVTFDGSASYDPDGTVFSYRWSFGSENATAQARFAEPGTYTVTLNVRDDDGTVTHESVDVTVRPDRPPNVTLRANATRVATGEPVRFTAVATDREGPVTDYDWSVPGNGSTVTARFAHGGTAPVGVVVTDARGQTAAAHVSIAVERDPLFPDDTTSTVTGAVVRPGTADGIAAMVIAAVIVAAILVRAVPDRRPRPEEVRDDEPPHNI